MRATNIVKAALEAGKRPVDPFPIAELSGKHKKPALQELSEVLDLRRMMRCIKHNIILWEIQRFTSCGATEQMLADETLFMRDMNSKDRWDTNVYRALYRNVIIGAVCCRAFIEPMFSARESNTSLVEALTRRERGFDMQYPHYLDQFSAYSARPEQYEQVYKSVVEWIISDGKAKKKDEKAVVREMLHILAAHEHLKAKILNGYQHLSRGDSTYLGRRDINYLESLRISPTPQICQDSSMPKGTVILLGIFQLEEITLPSNPYDTKARTYLVANPYTKQASTIPLWPCQVYSNSQTDYCPPPGVLHFFTTVLGKLGWRFTERAFIEWDDEQEDPQGDLPFHSVTRLCMFCDGERDDGLVERIG